MLILVLLATFATSRAAEAQPTRAGLPFYSEHFESDQYGAHYQNFWIAQDFRGIIYVANANGVLEHDGEYWRTIETPSPVMSLTIDDDGTVYAGLSDDVGFLRPTARGALQYVSLKEHLPHSHRELTHTWTTHATPEGIYFQSREHILRWDGAKFKVWNASGLFHKAFALNGRYFVRQQGVGLQEIQGDSLMTVAGGEQFADDQIWTMLPHADGMLVGSRQSGLYHWGRQGFEPFQTEADAYLADHQLNNGCVLPGGYVALGTLSGGVVIVGPDGALYDTLNPARGLPDAWVNYVFADRQGGLWMAFNSQGLMRADVVSPVSVFNEQLGLQGVVFNVNRRGNALYAATGAGFFEIDLEDHSAQRVTHPDPGVNSRLSEVWASTTFGDLLLLATTKGLLGLTPDNQVYEITGQRTHAVVASDVLPGAIYVGTVNGLELLRYQNGRWERDDRLPLIGAEVREIVEEPDGTVWFRGGERALYRVTAPDSGPVELRAFGPGDGLPEGTFGVSDVGGSLAIVHTSGVYRYRGAGHHPAFRRDSALDAPWAREEDQLYALNEDNQGRIWIVYNERTDILTPNGEGYEFFSPDALRLGDSRTHVVDVFIEDSGVAWLAYGDDIVRYDPNAERSYDYHYHALIRTVAPIGEAWDVFSGAHSFEDRRVAADQRAHRLPRLIHQYNDLRFEVASPSFNEPQRNEYQYYLEGYDDAWSAWTETSAVEYTNLKEGRYRMRVRARNAQGYFSSEGTFAFAILPPWYRTWWAYFAYASLFVALAALSVHYRRMRQENAQAQQQARELALERVVNERLTVVNDRLRQADLLKDQLLSNTSHELRTPITAILGFTSVLKDEAPQGLQEFLDIIEENGHRLMRTVTSMVDFARLQAGAIELNREPVEVGREVEQVVSRLAHLARKKELFFDLNQPQDLVHAWLDKKCLERVVENLLTNAIKFTEEGGVVVRVSVDDDSVYVRVQDTGIGMDSQFMPELFKAFKQESSGLTRSHEGSGLGLAITARLVELMEGEIDVKTVKGEGTTVTISFPVFFVAHADRKQGQRQISRRSSA